MDNHEKLKIAVQLSGHLRTFENCAPALRRHLLDRYDCDVFIHTWDKSEHVTKSWYPDNIRPKPDAVDAAMLAKLERLYAPKSVKVESQDCFDEPGHFGTHPNIKISLSGLKYMIYGQYQANQLREIYQQENGLSYDYVVVTRPDIMPLEDLDLTDFRHEFKFNKRSSIHLVHHSETRRRGQKFFTYPFASDVLYLATPETIGTICRLYLVFDRYYKDIKTILPAEVENPEISFFEYIRSKGIMPRQYQFYYAIKRKNDTDDLKLMPPTKALPNTASTLVKTAIKIYVHYCPTPLLRWTKSLLVRCKEALEYIENYEYMK